MSLELGRFLLSMLAVHATLAGAWFSRNRPHIVGMLPVLWCTSTRYFGKRKGHRYMVRGMHRGRVLRYEYVYGRTVLECTLTCVCVHTHSCVHKVMATTAPKFTSRYKYRVPDELAP